MITDKLENQTKQYKITYSLNKCTELNYRSTSQHNV